jgi:polyisoprenoid-binding protein YceI
MRAGSQVYFCFSINETMNIKKIITRQTLASLFVAAIALCSLPGMANAQTTYRFSAAKDKNIQVKGSSNVHDWTMTSAGIISQGVFTFDKNNILQTLSAFNFSMDAKSLKSGHSSMDSRTYKAMKADANPKILYKLTSAIISQVSKNEYLVKSIGNLTIAGETKIIQMSLKLIVNADKTMSCTGSEKIKLTDNKIDPPSFMMGAMKVGNDITFAIIILYKS